MSIMISTFAQALPLAHPYVGGPAGGPGWFFLFMPLLWILIIGTVVFLIRRSGFRRDLHQAAASAEGVLRERYARGEVDETEYRQRLEVLRAPRR
ncbi:SHOCT domain-containing protein [Glutamicibacter endophyticus]|uniref:SHOCT domain-containing protein n=1 Tax=Glutamicibacter sp. PS TaxID=3075634 RepID=UPI00283DFC3B|nr:hypothetical protein [Glutamicibacter sp. PS]MDR4533718.1 hypothetical protein [Glutamicibacter sp. PS]